MCIEIVICVELPGWSEHNSSGMVCITWVIDYVMLMKTLILGTWVCI